MVHHLAVGYMGVSQIPIAQVQAGGNPPQVTADNVAAPYIGARYWLSTLVGIDVALGFGYSGGSTSTTVNNTTTSVDTPSRTGFGVHAGLPLALASSSHFTFEAIPELTFGYATSTLKQNTPMGLPPQPDVSLSGIRFDIGARIGGEMQFGFIGIPQLSLQATIGLGFRYTQIKASTSDNSFGFSQSTPAFATTVQDAPWAIFTNTVSALYYF